MDMENLKRLRGAEIIQTLPDGTKIQHLLDEDPLFQDLGEELGKKQMLLG
jgi:hypothetical protein